MTLIDLGKSVGLISLMVFPFLTRCQTTNETLEEFARRREREMNEFAGQQKSDLDSMRTLQNKAFAKMLSGNWTRADLFPEAVAYRKAKPDVPERKEKELDNADNGVDIEAPVPGTNSPIVTPPVVESDREQNESLIDTTTMLAPIIPGDVVKIATDPEEVKSPPEKIMEPAEKGETDLYGDLALREHLFFGNETRIPSLHRWPRYGSKLLNSAGISEYWQKCSDYDSHMLLAYLAEQRRLLSLNSWSSYLMIREVAERNFDDLNNQELIIWFMMIQMGYDVRVYFNDHLTAVAAAFETKLLAKSYMVSAGKRYYFLSKKEGSKFYTYPGEHAHAVVRMNFKSADSGVYPSQWKQRTLTFPFDMKEISVSIPFNVHRTEFYETIPQNEFDSYFSNPGDDSFREKLLEAIGPALQSISNRDDRIRFLHAMVCLGVDYATDAQQFGHEKFCMPEEFLRYAKADCEDRTFFLNYLYRNILGVKTIGLVYPGHMAMAVAMDHPPSGATMITHHGKEYVFCDPTYIGATVGDMPSQYQGVSPEIVE